MTETETIKIPYFLSNKISLFENIQNGYILDFNKSVDSQLDWLEKQKSTIDELLNSTDFNIIQKQISENIEPIDVEISTQIKELKNNRTNNNEISSRNNNSNGNRNEIFDEPPPSLSDFTKNVETVIDLEKDSPINEKLEKLTISNLNSKSSISKINISDNIEETLNRLKSKETLSIASLNPLIEDIIQKNSKKSNILSKNKNESRSLNNSNDDIIIDKKDNRYSFTHELKDKTENRNLIINKIENKDLFKKVSTEKSEPVTTEPSSPDVITDFKRSLSIYTARKKKSTLTSLNDTIDSSATLRNTVEPTISLSPLNNNMEDDTLSSTLNGNTIINIDLQSLKNETNNNNNSSTNTTNNSGNNNKMKNKSNDDINMTDINQQKKKFSTLLDEVENLSILNSPIRSKNEELKSNKIDEFKDCEIIMDHPKPFTPVKSKSEGYFINDKAIDEFKDCDDKIENNYRKSKSTEKPKSKIEKRSFTAATFSILASPFTHNAHNEKKSKYITTTPDKKDIPNSIEGSKSFTNKLKGIWDSTAKGLQFAFLRNHPSSHSINSTDNDLINSNKKFSTLNKTSSTSVSLSPSMKLFYSPERDPVVSSSSLLNNAKSTNFRNEKLENILKMGSSSVPSKTKTNLFNSNFDDINIIDYKDSNAMSFATAIQSPSDSPLAYKKSEKKINDASDKLSKTNSILSDNIFKALDDDLDLKLPFSISNSSSPLYNKTKLATLKKSKSNHNIFNSDIATTISSTTNTAKSSGSLHGSSSNSSINDIFNSSTSKHLFSTNFSSSGGNLNHNRISDITNNNTNKGMAMNVDILNKENILKKSISDLASGVIHKDDLNKEISALSSSTTSSILGSSWNPLSTTTSSSATSSTIASIKEQPSLIPKNTKLKKTLSKKTTAATTRDKLKSLESAKIIKKREDDRKQKLRLNAERHKLYLKKKREEEEEKLANSQRQKEEEKRNKLEATKNKQKQMDMEVLLIKKRNEKIKQNDKKRQLKTNKEVAKSILLNNPNLYGTSSVIASTLDKFKNSPIIDTTVLLKKKNSSSQSSIMKKSKLSNGKKTSISSLLSSSSNNNSRISNSHSNSNSNSRSGSSNIIKKSAIPKAKSILTNKNKSTTTTTLKSHTNTNSSLTRSHPSSSTINNNTTNTTPSNVNLSTQNILSELNNPPTKPIILGLNNLDDSNKLANTSIISISSSRSSTTPYKGTILQDGEFPDIPSDDSDEECNRSSLIATWAKTPNLLKELEKQKNINPDDIFGGYRPCHLDEIFKGSHFKRHTPNENWADSSILHDDNE